MNVALGVMARAPSAPGKTRLAPHFSAGDLRALQRALVIDTLTVACATEGVDPIVFVTPDEAVDEIVSLAQRALPMVAQGCGDLGERMRRAIKYLIVDRSCEAAILIGTDVPLLTAAHLDEATVALRSGTQLVLGPADDGGYYLIGMTRVIDAMFDGIEWGTDRVLSQTTAVADRAGIRIHMTGSLYDVDTIDDLRRADSDLRQATSSTCEALRRFLATNGTPLA